VEYRDLIIRQTERNCREHDFRDLRLLLLLLLRSYIERMRKRSARGGAHFSSETGNVPGGIAGGKRTQN